MDVFLLIVVLIIAFALLAVNVYILIYFQHPDDNNTAYFPKLLVIFGLLLAEASVLLLPLDVANNTAAIGCDAGWNTTCGGLNMKLFWLLVFMGITFFVLILLPFAMFYYEADDGEGNRNNRRGCEAFKMQIMTLIVFFLVLVILFSTSATTNIPVVSISQSTLALKSYDINDMTLTDADIASSRLLLSSSVTLNMAVSLPIYTTALISFVGWFAFVIFGGIGLVALPLDLIRSFIYRPKFMPVDIYAQQKISLQQRTAELLGIGISIQTGLRQEPAEDAPKLSLWKKQKKKKLNRRTMNKFKQSVYILEQDTENLHACHAEYKQHNPLIPIFKLILGLFTALWSLLWIIQICLVMLPPDPYLGGFLSEYFIGFDAWFPLFGTLSVGAFTLYLLAAVVKGCFKFGVRCFCCSLHPMKLNKTYMNSFLFNLALILLCCIPIVQFCNQAFSAYTRLTGIQSIMGAQIRYLTFFRYFWDNNAFVYAFLGFSLFSSCYLCAVPSDRNSKTSELRQEIEDQVRGITST